MLYETYQAHIDTFTPVRWLAGAFQGLLNQPWPMIAHHPMIRSAAAACEMVARAGMWHDRPDFRIAGTMVEGRAVSVQDVPLIHRAFCTLLHFKKDSDIQQPKVLLVAPLSGHFSTLLRGTVETLLLDH